MCKLSIIVPVYNTEGQIGRCLKSITNQLDKEIEIIVINDGSTDGSEPIILEYVNRFPELFHYYKKENTGIADTRNYGIDKATGRYIMFVDSDDYIDIDLVENLSRYMERNIDIIKFKLSIVNEGFEEIKRVNGPLFTEIDGETAFNLLAFDDTMLDSPCVYLFKKELFTKQNLRFRVGTYHEDFGLVPLMILNADSVISTNVNGYYYVQTKNSITRNTDYQKTIKKLEDSLLHYDNMLQFVDKCDINKRTKENVKTYYTNGILLKLNQIKKEDRQKYIKQIRQRKMTKNIKGRNFKQFIKRIILTMNINWYLKLRKY